MLGSHLSIAGGMVNALLEAERLRLECVQVFTRNQRQWSARPLDPADLAAWRRELERLGWDDPSELRVVSHNSYLVNLASPDPALWKRSLEAQRDELERCEALGIGASVMHPGAHMNPQGRRRGPVPPDGTITPEEREGLGRVVEAIDRLHRDLPGHRTLVLIETTAGAGTALGGDFAHLGFIRASVREPDRVAFCLDTCHVVAAGYDMSTTDAAEGTLARFDELAGLASIRAIHLNDSVGALGSHLDRHAHIGEGTCGRACFRTILNHRAFRRVPMILETPKGEDPRGRPWDRVNIDRLRRIARTNPRASR